MCINIVVGSIWGIDVVEHVREWGCVAMGG